MNRGNIKKFLESFKNRKERIIVIVDYGNVDKWKENLGWKVDIQRLAVLIKHFSIDKQFLRRFYYGSDYGPKDSSQILTGWSRSVLERAKMNRFKVIKKRVKYICIQNDTKKYKKKCDLDVEMTVDLIKERDNYDTMILFSGDGDLMYAVEYLNKEFKKKCIVFSARGHIGKEVMDAKEAGFVEEILYADDFEYRLSKDSVSGFWRR